MATAVAKAYEVTSGEVIYGGRYEPGPFGTMVLDDTVLSGGFSPPPLPAWRTAMTSTNTLYEVGEVPTVLSSSIDWPSAGTGNFLMNNGGDSNPWRLHYGYGGAVFVPTRGTYGHMVFGSTGEASVSNQLTRFNLNAGTWEWEQQPDYAVSEAEAISIGADWYYSEADYAALPSGDKIDGVGESTFSASWDGTFPVGYKNWVARRKHSGSLTGHNAPHWFRYNMSVYVPASMTGTGADAIVVNQRGTIYGPFGQGHIPAGGTDSQWFEDVHGSGRRKHYLYARNLSTNAWTRLEPSLPDWTGFLDIIMPFAALDEANERIYYVDFNSTNTALYYADLSSGFSGLSFSGPTNLTDSAGGPGFSQSSNAVLCVPTSGTNAGKRLWFFREANTSNALLIDIDANTLQRLAITGLPSSSEWWAWSYDASANKVYITTKDEVGGVKSYRFTIPDTYTDAANYSVSTQTVALNGITIEDALGTTTWQYGERSKFISSLGVILITQASNKLLAYRPE